VSGSRPIDNPPTRATPSHTACMTPTAEHGESAITEELADKTTRITDKKKTR
jgi:hypothetical protein